MDFSRMDDHTDPQLAGTWSRAILLAGMWVTLAWAPVTELPRGIAQLLVATAGLLLGFASITPADANWSRRCRARSSS
jgi:hypothetical protein